MQAQIVSIEKTLATHCCQQAGYRLLNSISGIGPFPAAVILLETGNVEQFDNVGSVYLFNGKEKGEVNTKNANRYLAWAHVEVANFTIRYSEEVRRFCQRKKPHATVTWQSGRWRTSQHACFHMLSAGEHFSVERCFA